MRLKPRSEPLHPVLNGEYGATEKDEVAVCGCNHRIFGGNIDCAPVQGYLRWRGVTVPADDLTWKTGCAERQPGGSADEARADDRDAIDGHCQKPREFCVPAFESESLWLNAVVSHISRKTSEMWGTPDSFTKTASIKSEDRGFAPSFGPRTLWRTSGTRHVSFASVGSSRLQELRTLWSG
jgi:hypothetical protein